MWRYLVILIVCAGAAPFLPELIQNQLGVRAGGGRETALALSDARDGSGEDGRRERVFRITASRNGHFMADARLNNRPVEMLVDTGASVTALPVSVAEDIGIFLSNSDYNLPINTANGTTYGARAEIDSLRLGNIHLKHIDAIVLKDESLEQPLLGMSVLHRLDRFDISNGTLVLVQ